MADLAPRDIVARAVATEMERADSNHVFLDVTHIPRSRIVGRFPNIYKTCLEYGIDMTKHPVPIAPAAHYMMGGVKVNLWGETTIPGLYACGEVSCAAVHGANRLASNSLLETIVFSKRTIERTLAKNQKKVSRTLSNSTNRYEQLAHVTVPNPYTGAIPPLTLSALKELMWRSVGIVRKESDLREAVEVLGNWSQGTRTLDRRDEYELSNLTLLGLLSAKAALTRNESRGSHFRSDYIERSADWTRHLTVVGHP